MKRVKLVFDNKIRKFEIPGEQSHVHVKKLIEKATANRGFIPVLQYMDEDRDWITIGTEADLALCLQTSIEPKIYIFTPTDAIGNREKVAKDVENEPNGWVKFGFEGRADSESPEIVPSPQENGEAAAAAPQAAAAMETDEKGDEKVDDAQKAGAAGALPFDWLTLVEDFLTNQRALSTLVSDVYTAVQNGGDLKTAVLAGLDKEPFKSHPFVKAGKPDFQRMLGKINHMSVLLLHAGKAGIELALPIVCRGFAKMKNGNGGGVVDMAPAFAKIFPDMTKFLQGGLGNGQEATFDLGKVMRHMAAAGCQPRGGEADDVGGEPAQEDPEVAAAAKEGIVLHKGITCDICHVKPIIGARYKCMICPDFDMCEECKAKGTHPAEHPLISMHKPAPRGGFAVGRGHYKGAREMFRGPWGGRGGKGCGGKWPGHKRRAMKKMFKGWKGHGTPTENDNDAEGCKRPDNFPFGGRGRHRHHPFGGGRHRHPNRHHPFGSAGGNKASYYDAPAPPPPHAANPGTFAMPYDVPVPADAPANPWLATPGYLDSSSSSSSSSSESEFEMVEARRRHGSKGKGSHKKHKGKKRMKRLLKKRHKIAKKIEKTHSKQRKLGRRLARLQSKEGKLNRLLSAEHNMMRVEQGPAPANPPGHDPNPNRGPQRPQWPYHNPGPWENPTQFAPPSPHGPTGRAPRQQQGPPAPPRPTGPLHAGPAARRQDYANQLALLIEMGFTDVPVLKRLLKETKGDIKSVIALKMGAAGKAFPFGKLE